MNRIVAVGLAAIALSHAPSAIGNGLPDAVPSPAGESLQQVGSGTARYLFWRVYDGALYAPIEASSADIKALDVPVTLILSYHRDLAAEDIIKATETTLEQQYPQDAPRAEINALLAPINQALQPVTSGDAYRLDFHPQPEPTLQLSLNEQVIFSSNSQEQAQAYFGLWLGEPPLSDSFKRAILGQ